MYSVSFFSMDTQYFILYFIKAELINNDVLV